MEKTELAMAITTLEFLLIQATKDDTLPQGDYFWSSIVDRALAYATGRPFMTEKLKTLKQHAGNIYGPQNAQHRTNLLRTVRVLSLRADERPSDVEAMAHSHSFA